LILRCIWFIHVVSRKNNILRHDAWKVKKAEPRRRQLLGSGSMNTSSPWQRWRQATIREMCEAPLPRVPAPGWQCRYNGTRDTTSLTSIEERCFLLGPCRGYIWRIETRLTWRLIVGREVTLSLTKAVSPRRKCRVSLQRVCRETDHSESETVVRHSPQVEVWEAEQPHCCKPLRTHPELVVRRAPASEDCSRGTRNLREPLRGNPLPVHRSRHSKLRRLNACCSELQKVWISDSAIANCSFNL
jgi:hypothetical protein